MNNWMFRAPKRKVRPGAAAAHLAVTSAVLLLGACSAVQDSSHVDASSFAARTNIDFTSIQPELFSIAGTLSNAWADFDGDGDLDFAVSIKGGEVRLYRNDNGLFVNVGAAMDLPATGAEIRGLSWGDYDGDGDPDLLAGSNVSPTPGRSYVFRNDGTNFAEVAQSIGLAIPGRFARQSNWIDYDNDGDFDLYVVTYGPNLLYRNEGDGRFTEVAKTHGIADPRSAVGAAWGDFDNDGDLDLGVMGYRRHRSADFIRLDLIPPVPARGD